MLIWFIVISSNYDIMALSRIKHNYPFWVHVPILKVCWSFDLLWSGVVAKEPVLSCAQGLHEVTAAGGAQPTPWKGGSHCSQGTRCETAASSHGPGCSRREMAQVLLLTARAD